MTRSASLSRRVALASVCLSLAFSLVPTANAHEYTAGALKIGHPWSRATPKGAKVGAGYLTITNTGTTADRLIGGTVEGAKSLEVHEMKMDGDMMKMRRLDAGLEIAPGKTVEFKPGSYHLMFTDLGQPMTEGSKVKGTLAFEKAGKIDVVFNVEGLGAQPKAAVDHGAAAHAH